MCNNKLEGEIPEYMLKFNAIAFKNNTGVVYVVKNQETNAPISHLLPLTELMHLTHEIHQTVNLPHQKIVTNLYKQHGLFLQL